MSGHPVQIASIDPSGQVKFDYDALAGVTSKSHVKHLPVSVVSVMGQARGGKSLMLNWFVSYLQGDGNKDGTWLERGMALDRGFETKNGTGEVTNGIWVWSEPFIVKDADGNETAVVLMDTQGMHGVNKSANQSNGIHAMGLLLASHQVYNVSGHVDESTLQHLELSSAMGEVASESFTDHTFQSLQFLVRDWFKVGQGKESEKNGDGYFAHGADGGKEYMDQFMSETDADGSDKDEELVMTRRRIKSMYDTMSCFLLPFPGQELASKAPMDVGLDDLDADFKNHLTAYVEGMFAPEAIVKKQLGGHDIPCSQLAFYFEKCGLFVENGNMPEISTIVTAMDAIEKDDALRAALKLYDEKMDGYKYYTDGVILQNVRATEDAIDLYKHMRKYTKATPYDIEDIRAKIKDRYAIITAPPPAPQPTTFANTATLFLTAILLLLMSNIISFMGMSDISDLLYLLQLVFWIFTVAYIYVNVSGTDNLQAKTLAEIAGGVAMTVRDVVLPGGDKPKSD